VINSFRHCGSSHIVLDFAAIPASNGPIYMRAGSLTFFLYLLHLNVPQTLRTCRITGIPSSSLHQSGSVGMLNFAKINTVNFAPILGSRSVGLRSAGGVVSKIGCRR
jgi:hypothetical protein